MGLLLMFHISHAGTYGCAGAVKPKSELEYGGFGEVLGWGKCSLGKPGELD